MAPSTNRRANQAIRERIIMTIFLRSDTREEMEEAAEAAGLIVDDPQTGEPMLVTASHAHQLDVIGTIYEETGNILIDPETGEEYPEMGPIPGYHVNVKVLNELPAELQPFVITVITPYRIFSGDNVDAAGVYSD